MIDRLSAFIDTVSEYFAHRKGLLPLIGMALVLVNFILQVIPTGWLTQTNFFLHVGILLAFFGFLLARAL